MSDASELSEDVLSLVEKEVSSLVKQLQAVMESHEKINTLSAKKNPVTSGLMKYKKVLDGTKISEHLGYFDKIYQKFRLPILAGVKSDDWIKDSSIKIQYGEGVEGTEKICIRLSAIYTTSCKLRTAANERLEGMPADAYDGCMDLIYPDTILLHLYRIFRERCEKEEEKKKLTDIISQIEESLGVETGSEPKSQPLAIPTGLFGQVNQMLKSVGIVPPEGTVMPNEREVTQLVGGIFSNPTLQGVVGGMMKELQGCSSFGEAFGRFSKNFSDPNFTSALAQSLASTAQSFDPSFVAGAAGPATGPQGPS